jgi:hypothetical protein
MGCNDSFLSDLHLYKGLDLDDAKKQHLKYRIEGVKQGALTTKIQGFFDCYCPHCKRESTFQSEDNINVIYYESYADGKELKYEYVLLATYCCSRVASHKVVFFFKNRENSLLKIGQYPSKADLEGNKLSKYSKVLSSDYISDLSRAIGLASHGIGAGSLVYLRRVFEFLLEEAHQEALKQNKIDDNQYNTCRVVERIELLKNFLPDFMVQNKTIYGILSKGIHELTEEECLAFFDTLRVSIEMILDEKISKNEKEKKRKEITKNLEKIHSLLK